MNGVGVNIDGYEAKVSEQKDGTFFAEIPKLPGCWAQGETKEEALDILREAKGLWIKTQKEEGERIPNEE